MDYNEDNCGIGPNKFDRIQFSSLVCEVHQTTVYLGCNPIHLRVCYV